MHIAVCINTLSVGGAEKAAINLVESLLKAGHQAHLIVLHKHGQYQLPKNFPVTFIHHKKRLKLPLFRRQRMAKKLTRTLKKLAISFDLILSNLHHCNQVLSKTKLDNIWYIIHSPLSRELKYSTQPEKHLKQKIKIYDGQKLIAVSHSIADDIRDNALITPQQLTVIHNAYDIDKITQLATAAPDNLPQTPYYLFVARFSPEKRFDIAFSAFSQFQSNVKLVVLTNDQQAVLTMAAQYQLTERIICPGFTQNPYPWFKQAKLLFNCSDYEGFPNTFVEALILNTPVISFKFDNKIPEALTGKLENWVVASNTAQALTEKFYQAEQHQFSNINADILPKVCAEYVIKQIESLKSS